jgi:hypothetical protein
MSMALALVIVARPAFAQEVLNQDQVSAKLFEQMGVAAPRTAPEGKQAGAPSATAGAATLVDRPGFAQVLGLAFGSDIVKSTDGVVTIDATPFTLVSAVNPAVLDRQELYEKYEHWRRVGISASLGGKGQAFDRNGDGTVDEALTAKNLNDIVNWELRVRVSGSRDRRDRDNFAQYLKRAGQEEATFLAAFKTFLMSHSADFQSMAVGINTDAAKFEAFLKRSDVREELQAMARLLEARSQAVKATNKLIDTRPQWTVAASGVQQKPEFGSNRWKVALRGAAHAKDFDHTVNAEWSRVETEVGDKPSIFKAAYEASTLLRPELALGSGGVTLGISASLEHYRDVPDARHDLVAKVAFKLELPVSRGSKVPFTIMYANHEDLLTNQKGVIGHVGFTWDLSALKGAPR